MRGDHIARVRTGSTERGAQMRRLNGWHRIDVVICIAWTLWCLVHFPSQLAYEQNQTISVFANNEYQACTEDLNRDPARYPNVRLSRNAQECFDRKWAMQDKWEKDLGLSWLQVGLTEAAGISAFGAAVFWSAFFLAVWTYKWIKTGFVGARRRSESAGQRAV